MNKNNQTIGIILLVAALGLMAWQSQDQAARAKAYKESVAVVEAQRTNEELTARANATQVKIEGSTNIIAAPVAATLASAVTVKPVSALPREDLAMLENSLLRVTFTTRGGAVREVALKDYPKTQDSKEPFVITAPEALPFYALSLSEKRDEVDLNTYTMVQKTDNEIVFARTVAPGLTLERHYTLTTPNNQKRDAQGYLLEQKLVWKNATKTDLQLTAFSMNVGVASHEASDPDNIFLNFGYFDGKEGKFIDMHHFRGGGFLFWNKAPQSSFELTQASQWASVKSKFFTLVTTPKAPALGVYAMPIMTGADSKTQSITGGLSFAGPVVKAGGSTTTELTSYLGPKEYARLSSIGGKQDEIMQWGWPIFSFFSKFFISMLNWLGEVTRSYGVAIVVLTLVIRAAMWPLTGAAAKASKKMAAVQPMLKEIQEKYKNSPERLQKETLKIFQDNQVNPLAGCLPALLQIPVFIGFFYMLRSAAELRFESFLWIKDLSMPDTVMHIAGFPINPLPVLMLVTMYYQIKLTPSSGDPQQQKIMQFTPFIFSFLLYNFSAGLTLYWTLSNVVSIAQQVMVNRQSPPPANGKDGGVIEVKATAVK